MMVKASTSEKFIESLSTLSYQVYLLSVELSIH